MLYEKCGYDLDCITGHLHEEIQKNSGDKKVNLIGMSFGGVISQVYTKRYPNSVNKIILIHSFSKFNEPYLFVRSLIQPHHIKNIEKYEYKLDNDVDVMVYNCVLDRILMGTPPENADNINDELICIHGHVPERIKREMEEFLGNKIK